MEQTSVENEKNQLLHHLKREVRKLKIMVEMMELNAKGGSNLTDEQRAKIKQDFDQSIFNLQQHWSRNGGQLI